MNSKNPDNAQAHRRFLIALGVVVLTVVLILVVIDFNVRQSSQVLNKEATRVDQLTFNSLDGSRQARSNSVGGGLLDKVVRCYTGTLCEPFADNYVVAPIEAGKEYELANKIATATGYTLTPAASADSCSLTKTGICRVTLFHDKFRLDVYLQPQDGNLSDKEVAPSVWRSVYLHLVYRLE